MVKYTYCIVFIACIFSACTTSKQSTTKANYQKSIDYDSLMVRSLLALEEKNMDMVISVHEIEFFPPSDTAAPLAPKKLKRKLITQNQTVNTFIADTLITKVSNNTVSFSDINTTRKTDTAPFRWHKLVGIIALLLIYYCFIFKKYIK